MPERIVLRQALYLPWERHQIMTQPAISEDLISAHGLNSDEYAEIIRLLDREPSFTELGIFSAMWNEHCSYKSSKVAHPANYRASGDLRTRRERRCGGYR